MRPYVVRGGDHILKVAHRLGFNADTVWNDAANDDLRKLRPDPNMLLAGDLLYVPDDAAPIVHGLITGSTNTFVVSPPPTVQVAVKFIGGDASDFASKTYAIKELEDLAGLATDDNGVATFKAPVTLDRATVVFADSGDSYVLRIGGLDPVDTKSGAMQRIRHLNLLGQIGLQRTYDVSDDGPVERDDAVLALALMAFQAGQSLPATGLLDDATTDALQQAHGR